MTANRNEDPAVIEQDVERTQDAMGETVHKLEDKLNPRKFAQSLFSDDNAATTSEAWDVVRRSPAPVALIAAGVAWLFATSDAPMIARLRGELKQRLGVALGSTASNLRSRSDELAPIGPPPTTGGEYDRRSTAV